MKTVLKAAVVVLAVIGLVATVALVWLASRGISARVDPGSLEPVAARAIRDFAIPRAERDRPNPVAMTGAILEEGMTHYADHCAACHAADGSGQTEMGRALLPRVPDMRLPATQSMTDGELFYIIENGVRMTGMPGWSTGTAEGEESTWHLVHFLRELPRLTPGQVERIEGMIPRPPAEVRQEIEEERFLQGGDPPAAAPGTDEHSGAH